MSIGKPVLDNTMETAQTSWVKTRTPVSSVLVSILHGDLNAFGVEKMQKGLEEKWTEETCYLVVDLLELKHFTAGAPFKLGKVLRWAKTKKPDHIIMIATGPVRMLALSASLSATTRAKVFETRALAEVYLGEHNVAVSLPSGDA